MAEEAPLSRTETLPVRNDASAYQYYGGGYYTNDRAYQTFHIPSQHPAFDNARRSVSHALGAFGNAVIHPYGEQTVRNPHVDIRESKTNYFIDVDIPGLDSKDSISLKWLNSSTLFLQAATKHLPLPDEEKDVHLVVQERRTGTYARAFQFPIPVEQEQTKARLGYGVVRLTVPKKGGQDNHKEVQVEHAGH